MDHDLPDDATMRSLVAEIGTRATVAVGLAGIALIHMLDSIGKWSETRYLFWMYVGLMIASLATAGWVLFTRSRTALLAAVAVAASALVGYVVSRTVGLPGATDDIGNWTEPLGLASLFVEGAVVAAGLAGLSAARGTVTLTLARPARRRDLAAA
jgi:hypothetical protein